MTETTIPTPKLEKLLKEMERLNPYRKPKLTKQIELLQGIVQKINDLDEEPSRKNSAIVSNMWADLIILFNEFRYATNYDRYIRYLSEAIPEFHQWLKDLTGISSDSMHILEKQLFDIVLDEKQRDTVWNIMIELHYAWCESLDPSHIVVWR